MTTIERRKARNAAAAVCYKALLAAPDLTNADRRVGAVYVDYWNNDKESCYAGMRQIAKRLGVDKATVQRSAEHLCDPKDGLFVNLNPGQGRKPDIRPRMERMLKIVAEFEATRKRGTVRVDANSSGAEANAKNTSNCTHFSQPTERTDANKEHHKKASPPQPPSGGLPISGEMGRTHSKPKKTKIERMEQDLRVQLDRYFFEDDDETADALFRALRGRLTIWFNARGSHSKLAARSTALEYLTGLRERRAARIAAEAHGDAASEDVTLH